MTTATLHITFERPDGSRYTAELDYCQPIRLLDGEVIEANALTCGDSIECHDYPESGHTVIR